MVARVIRFFTENWGLKLAALGLAVLMWMWVRASEPERNTFPGVDVRVDLEDPDWQLAGKDPPTVSVTVLGPAGELLSLAGEPPIVVVQVDRVTDTLESQVLPLQWVQLPGGIRDARVIDIQPDTIRLHYERLASGALPVKVRTIGSVPDGFRLTRPVSTNPAVVEVRGRVGRLTGLDSVPLLPVDISGLRSTTNVPTPVDTAALDGLSVTPREVNVMLRVVPDSMVAPDDSARQRPPL